MDVENSHADGELGGKSRKMMTECSGGGIMKQSVNARNRRTKNIKKHDKTKDIVTETENVRGIHVAMMW